MNSKSLNEVFNISFLPTKCCSRRFNPRSGASKYADIRNTIGLSGFRFVEYSPITVDACSPVRENVLPGAVTPDIPARMKDCQLERRTPE